MSLVYVFLADGFEEIEALTTVDLLRRAGIETKTVSISEKYEVLGAHKIEVKADLLFDEADFEKADMIFLPGGIPGTPNLAAHRGLTEQILAFHKQGKKLAAICAAPGIYGELGLLEGKAATCYPGFEDKLKGALPTEKKVITTDHITTARGMGVSIEMGLEIIKVLDSEEKAKKIASQIQYASIG